MQTHLLSDSKHSPPTTVLFPPCCTYPEGEVADCHAEWGSFHFRPGFLECYFLHSSSIPRHAGDEVALESISAEVDENNKHRSFLAFG
jgi:hypothetical protein